MSTGIHTQRVRWNPWMHGSLEQWSEGKPEKIGYYRVMTYVQTAAYVCDGYKWNGSYWVTPSGSVAKTVARYLPESWKETR